MPACSNFPPKKRSTGVRRSASMKLSFQRKYLIFRTLRFKGSLASQNLATTCNIILDFCCMPNENLKMAIPKKHAAIKCSTIRGKFTHFLNCRGTKNYTNNMQSSPPVKQCHHGYLHLFNLALNLLNLSMKPTTNILMINCYRILIKSCHTYLLSTLFWRENLCTICLE